MNRPVAFYLHRGLITWKRVESIKGKTFHHGSGIGRNFKANQSLWKVEFFLYFKSEGWEASNHCDEWLFITSSGKRDNASLIGYVYSVFFSGRQGHFSGALLGRQIQTHKSKWLLNKDSRMLTGRKQHRSRTEKGEWLNKGRYLEWL